MARQDEHPTVRAVRERGLLEPAGVARIDREELRRICRDAGADDCGFVSVDRKELDEERAEVLQLFPSTKTLISLVCRMNPDAVRSPTRSLANHEFHETGDAVNDAARRIVGALAERGIRAVNPPMAFPMEMDRFPGKVWNLSLKPLAVAAGLGQMGIHRNVIHPRFGNFILLGAVLVDAEVEGSADAPIDYNPCLGCKLCVAACPVGAIGQDGYFDFSACMTHNYREFLGGFTDWVETVANSSNAEGYRSQVTDSESASVWQSLAFGPNYKAAYCLAVCPAGEDVIRPFLGDRARFVGEVVRPLQAKQEAVYVQPGTDAEAYVAKRFPHKRIRHAGGVTRPTSVALFLKLMQHSFQRGRAAGLDAVYHFRFTGAELMSGTVTIRDQKLHVQEGLQGQCDLRITADSAAWVRMLRKEVGPVRLLLTGKVRLWGDPRLFAAFGRCFP